MKIRIIKCDKDGVMQCHEAPIEQAEEFAAGLGHPTCGVNNNPWHRPELQGQPRFDGLCGPMWDRDAIRYECPEANDTLSR